MFEHTRRNLTLVGAGAALTFCLAGGAALGVVPQAGDGSSASGRPVVAAVSGPVPPAGPVATAPTSTAPPPPPTTAKPAVTAAPRTTTPRTAPARTVAPAPTSSPDPAPAPQTVPRRNPSSAEVQAAIAQIHQRIPFYTPTEAQAREFGNQVCSAFDAGATFAQVRASVLQAASRIPLVTISSADADFAVRTAVALFCPGYQSKLG